ncbi:hypothetical protein HWV23_03340 [Natronomonas halophila]|uniref:hypothetical protein n=1 Tax=Natronomonas halophila TaxID=2747817 RepID=UPI0015B3A55D|nr:hypothetical protein [Natronomonas halophila]QLD84785.1 hypothetical protein HWV23_03340 [Natronomonas halophila]
MSLAKPKGPLTEIGESPSDHECEHPSPCPHDPVVRVPHPNQLGATGITLCPFHLAIWIDERADAVDPDIEALAADDALLELEDLPPWTRHAGQEWSRLGIDHHGQGHLYREVSSEDTARVILVDADLEVQDVKRVPGERDLGDWIRYVRRKRGWMRLDPDARAAHEGGDGL